MRTTNQGVVSVLNGRVGDHQKEEEEDEKVEE